jgi:hypothetical protein
LLEAGEDGANLIGVAEVGDGIVIFQAEKGGELVRGEFFDTDIDILSEYNIDKGLLLRVEAGPNDLLGGGGASKAGDGEKGIGDVGKHIKEVTIFGVEDVDILMACEAGFDGAVFFEVVKVFEEEEPGGLLGVVELGGAAGFFSEHVVDVSEGLFEHKGVLRYS